MSVGRRQAVRAGGGFLGPDLTNVARRVAPGQLGEVLTVGRGPMPAFHLDEAEQKALMAYFTAVDATGQGTPLPPPGEGGAYPRLPEVSATLEAIGG